jgi:Zn-finger nucleic acid-binding protein
MSTCPRDQLLLASNDVDGYRYYSCERCNGFWIPGTVLDRALSERGIQDLRAIRGAGPGDVTCPDCRAACEAIGIEGCDLDRCARCHGVWLDAGEVGKLKRLFPERSAVVAAEEGRLTDAELAPIAIVDSVVQLLALLIR